MASSVEEGSSSPPSQQVRDMDPTAAAFHPSSFRIASAEEHVPQGGMPPHATFLGVPIPPGGGPISHPSIPEFIWVLDPSTRKLRVPTSLIIPTAATATVGTTPSLCIAFLEHRCRHPWCRQAHIPPLVVTRLRAEAQAAPTCCHEHHSPLDITFLSGRFSHVDVVFPTGRKVSVPSTSFAVTVGLQRHVAQSVPRTSVVQSFEVASRMICRLHLGNRCRYLEDCNNLHVCRELETIQRTFAEIGADRSPVVSGTPTPPPSHHTPVSSQTTPIAAGQPSPCPPSYDHALHQNSRSPPFHGLPLPSPITSPPAGSSAPPHTLHVNNRYASLQALGTQHSFVVMNGRPFTVSVSRIGVQSDEVFESILSAQTVLSGVGRVEAIDILKGGADLPSPGAGHHQSSVGLSASLSTLPPPLTLNGASGNGTWSMDSASQPRGASYSGPSSTPPRSNPQALQQQRGLNSASFSGDRGRPLVSLFSDTGHSPVEFGTASTDIWGTPHQHT